MDKNVLDTEKAEDLDDTHAVIGQMAAVLLKTGRPLELAGLSDLLKQRLENSADALHKKEYHDALNLLAKKVQA